MSHLLSAPLCEGMTNDECPMTKEFPGAQLLVWTLAIGASLNIGHWSLVIKAEGWS